MTAQTQSEGIGARQVRLTVIVISVGCMIFSLFAVFIGFHQNLYSFHSFRQTQTALATESLVHGGSFFRYEVPVLGPPWAVPFEFPLYQWIVACAVRLFNSRLEETGRSVSIFFFYLCFLPLASILRRLRFSWAQVCAALAIFAVSPLYIFVSRLFMIESTALFFSLMYVEQVVRMALGESGWRFRHMIAAAVFGALGGVVKVTTFAPYFVLGVGLVGLQAWKLSRRGEIRLPWAATAGFLDGAVPLVATWYWTRFADDVKGQNPLAAYLTSSQLRSWNFGTLAERLQIHNYLQLLRYANDQVGYLAAGVLVAVVYSIVFRRWNRVAAVCVILYTGTAMLFFNLYINHEYYPYAAAVLLVVAVGAMIVPFLELPGWRAWVGVALLVIEMAAGIARYHRYYLRYQENSSAGLAGLASIVDSTIKPDDVIVIMGMGWSPVLPYQAQRRAIMDLGPDTQTHAKDLHPLEESIENQGHGTIAAVVACDTPASDDRLRTILQQVRIENPRVLDADGCDVYERAVEQGSAAP